MTGIRLRSLGRLAWRNVRARRLRALLTTAGIVLGVALIFGVLLLTATIDSTFRNLFTSVYGKTDLVVEAADFNSTLPARKLTEIEGVDGVEEVQGALLEVFTRIGADGRPAGGREADLSVIGVDPDAPDTAGVKFTSGREESGPREITVEERWADDQGIRAGDRVRLGTPRGVKTFTVTGTFQFSQTFGFGGQGFASMTLDEARLVMGKPRGFSEIRIVLSGGADLRAVETKVREAVGPGPKVATPRGKSDDLSEQLRGLDVLLSFFAAMGLFVGGFLIFNSFAMTVLQRQREIGMLRTLGADRRAITRLILREALLLGAVGTALGLALGVGLAVGLVELMASLGFPVSGLAFSGGALVTAVVAGLVVTVVAALVPARRAGRVSPLTAVLATAEGRRAPRPWRAVAGSAMLVLGLGGVFLLAQSDDEGAVAAGFLGVLLIFFGVSLLAPFAIAPLVRVLSWPLRKVAPIEGRLASDSARANPSRTAATASGLMIGLALVTAFGSLASSFLGSVNDQIDDVLAGDFTIQPEDFNPGQGPQKSIAPELRDRIEQVAGVEVATPSRLLFTEDVVPGEEGLAVGIDPSEYGKVDDSEFSGGRSEGEVFGRLGRGEVTVGDAIAKAKDIEAGDRVTLQGAAGRRQATVVAVVENALYGGQAVSMSLGTMAAVYGVTGDSQLTVKAEPGRDRVALEREVERLVTDDFPQLEVLSNAELKEDLEDQLNAQFGFFNALLAIAVIVSLFGLVNTLSMNVLERTREIGVLRALGSSRWQVRRAIGDEGLVLAGVGAFLGIAVGLLLGYVFVRGVAASAPSVDYSAPLGTVLAVALAGVVLGLLASILPARRAARLDVIRALSYE